VCSQGATSSAARSSPGCTSGIPLERDDRRGGRRTDRGASCPDSSAGRMIETAQVGLQKVVGRIHVEAQRTIQLNVRRARRRGAPE